MISVSNTLLQTAQPVSDYGAINVGGEINGGCPVLTSDHMRFASA